MKTITMIIEAGKDLFSAYSTDDYGICGAGETIEECKQNVLECIEFIKEEDQDYTPPEVLKGEYEIVYKYDTESFLQYYKGVLTNSAIERLSGINQRQIHHYASGLHKPRKAQKQKIQNALQEFGKELSQIELI